MSHPSILQHGLGERGAFILSFKMVVTRGAHNGFFFQFPKSPPPNTHIQISQVLGEICVECLYPESQKPSLYPYQTEPAS